MLATTIYLAAAADAGVISFKPSPEAISLIISVITSVVVGAGVFSVLMYRVKQLESDGTEHKNDIKSISSKLDILIGKVSILLKDSIADTLSASASPRKLNELGMKVLKDSSIEQVLEPMFEEIVDQVRCKNPENPYQAQEALFEVAQLLKDDEGLQPAIENGAFLSGHTPDEVLYVGALNMRDRVIEALGLQVGDIDKHDPKKKKLKK